MNVPLNSCRLHSTYMPTTNPYSAVHKIHNGETFEADTKTDKILLAPHRKVKTKKSNTNGELNLPKKLAF